MANLISTHLGVYPQNRPVSTTGEYLYPQWSFSLFPLRDGTDHRPTVRDVHNLTGKVRRIREEKGGDEE